VPAGDGARRRLVVAALSFIIALAVAAKFGISSSYDILYQLAGELSTQR